MQQGDSGTRTSQDDNHKGRQSPSVFRSLIVRATSILPAPEWARNRLLERIGIRPSPSTTWITGPPQGTRWLTGDPTDGFISWADMHGLSLRGAQAMDLSRLREREMIWRDAANHLREYGYELRSRYWPDWKPSWKYVLDHPDATEDAIVLPVGQCTPPLAQCADLIIRKTTPVI